jgi:hypothetical protein
MIAAVRPSDRIGLSRNDAVRNESAKRTAPTEAPARPACALQTFSEAGCARRS